MKKETRELLKYISNNPKSDKNSLDKNFEWKPSYEGLRGENSSAKWSSDERIMELVGLGFVRPTGSTAYPTFTISKEGEHFLQEGRETFWQKVLIGIVSALTVAIVTKLSFYVFVRWPSIVTWFHKQLIS